MGKVYLLSSLSVGNSDLVNFYAKVISLQFKKLHKYINHYQQNVPSACKKC